MREHHNSTQAQQHDNEANEANEAKVANKIMVNKRTVEKANSNDSVLTTVCRGVWEYPTSSSTSLHTHNATMTRKGVLEYSSHVHPTYNIGGYRVRESNAFSYRTVDFSIISCHTTAREGVWEYAISSKY